MQCISYCIENNDVNNATQKIIAYIKDELQDQFNEIEQVILSDKIPATDKEVSEALISEAKRRGYKNGNYKCLSNYFPTIEKVKDVFFIRDGCLFAGLTENCNIIFRYGVWAEIIEEPVYEWRYVYDGTYVIKESIHHYTSKKDFKLKNKFLTPIKKVKGSKRIRK